MRISKPLIILKFLTQQLLCCLCCIGCGYRWQPDFPTGHKPSIWVPYIAGDSDGALTGEIVRAITASGMAEVSQDPGHYRLHIAMTQSENQIVGYRRDRQKVQGEVKKNIVACEARKSLIVEAALYEGDKEESAYGPYTICSDIDYDYLDGDSLQDLTFVNASGIPTTVLSFSLGQLESPEAAQEAASRPLNERLAQKIVDVIFSEW